MSRILLIEDEEHLAEGLAFNLRNWGYDIDIAATGEEGLEAANRQDYDLILLDVMLPGIDGLEVARRLRASGQSEPVLMLTARNRPGDVIAGLDAGADDYITKPFDLEEVLARIRGVLRRQVWSRASSSPEAELEQMEYGRWTVDFTKFIATHPDRNEVKLTAKEMAMLRLLAEKSGEVISRESFLRDVWGLEGAIETRTVDNFVRKLRQLFEEDASEPRHLLSVRGVGYRFVP